MLVNVLVIGSGGREHALGWKVAQSPKVKKVFTAPGNGGTENNVDIQVDDFEGLIRFVKENECFTIVGPEAPLANGIVNEFNKAGLKIFGPTKEAARLESSKIWAKEFMKQNDIPTAKFEVFDDPKEAMEYVDSVPYQVVIKADGLAAGKGVIVSSTPDQAKSAIDLMLNKKAFGEAGGRIIIEEKIEGVEASFIALSDGKIAIPMATSQDHKQVYDGDKGPNTGGMGAYSPTPVINDELADIIQKEIIDKTVSVMHTKNTPFQGFLYAGIMIKEGRPYVLEFNVRMGDPECQPIMMRMDFDLFEYLLASSEGRLGSLAPPRWKDHAAVCVVLASKGYPNSYPKGEAITGLEEVEDSVVFHAGTKKESGKILTTGGRVLGVTALGEDLKEAISKAYNAAEKINWPSKYYRRDIGKKGLAVL